ncbi:MAG TPA: preprotein translocase subunit YajC [Acidimicrobiales bacterium]|nr:preprotein translocase subunit YajC [Acidimicrobiales bacterium]
MLQLLFPFIFLALMWVLLVRPQQQRVRQQRDLVASLEIGDEVVTAGGILGRITGLTDQEATMEVAPGVNMRFLRGAINARLDDDLDETPAGELTERTDEGNE